MFSQIFSTSISRHSFSFLTLLYTAVVLNLAVFLIVVPLTGIAMEQSLRFHTYKIYFNPRYWCLFFIPERLFCVVDVDIGDSVERAYLWGLRRLGRCGSMMRVYIIQRRFSNLVFWSSGLTKNKYAVTILRRIKTMSHPLLCASSGVDLVSSVFRGVFPLQTFICVTKPVFLKILRHLEKNFRMPIFSEAWICTIPRDSEAEPPTEVFRQNWGRKFFSSS